MRILAIYGSPHQSGNSAFLAEEYIRLAGGDAMRVYAYEGRIAPCADCGLCSRESRCAIDDDFAAFLAQVRQAERIVLSAPVYFGDLPGPLISLFSRLQYLWMRRRAGDEPLPALQRRGVILLSGGGHGKADRAITAARIYLRQLGCGEIDVVTSLQTDVIPAREDETARQAIADVVRATV